MSPREEKPIRQAGVIPYRIGRRGPEFCLITSIRKGNWGFPKGIIDPGETAPQTALKEAEEEAGLHGTIEDPPLGKYCYEKWNTSLVVTVYLMEVTVVNDHWEEASLRDRRWCLPEEARSAIRGRPLEELLDAALERIEAAGGSGTSGC